MTRRDENGRTFLAGNDPMTERLRAHDWSQTPLGPPEQWSQEVRTAVDEVLDVLRPVPIGEALLSSTEEALRESEARYQTLFNSVDEGICILEMIFDEDNRPIDYRFLEYNPTFEQQTGMIDAEGKTARQMVPDLDESWFEIYGKVALTGESVRFENHAPAMNRWFDVYAVRVGRPENHRVALFFNNITERKEADERKDRFMALLSHELRNPLAPIKLSLHLLDLVEPGSTEALGARRVIERQVDQLTRLVDDLLDVTRVTRNKIQLQTEAVELNQLLENTVEDHHALFAARDVALDFERHHAPIFVNADCNRLRQIVGNLLQNAAKFTAPGGHTDVSVSVNAQRHQAEIRVADTGIGMSDETLANLFEPFIQADTSLDHSSGGLGLGLALVKGLVELHGGKVRASSAGLDQGAEFVVSLPLTDAEQAHAPALPRPDPLPRRRVLVIEDNIDVAKALSATFEMHGHQVEIAHDGAEGVDRAAGFRPDIVFCDIGLPGIDGYEVAQRLRALPHLRSTVLVALSGYATPEDVSRSHDAGFDQHVAKPPKIATLRAAVAAAPVQPPAD